MTEDSRVLCREREQTAICTELRRASQQRRAGVVFVCGVPGVGKSLTTATALSTCDAWARRERMPAPQVAWINCMALRTPNTVWKVALAALAPEADVAGGKAGVEPAAAQARVQWRFNNRPPGQEKVLKPCASKRDKRSQGSRAPPRMPVVVLDELDALLRGAEGLTTLCQLFAMATAPGAHGVIIGVANALDFAIHAREELRAAGIEPTEVVMPAYTAADLTVLLEARLGEMVGSHDGSDSGECALSPGVKFVKPALQLCARRVAAATGDMRRALQVCGAALGRAVGQVDQQAPGAEGSRRQQAKAVAVVTGDARQPQLPTLWRRLADRKKAVDTRADPPVTVTVGHMAAALSAVMRDTSSCMVKILPPQQQLLLAAVVRRVERNAAGSHCTVSELLETYTQLCKAARLPPLAESECATALGVLNDQALITFAGHARACRRQRVALRVPAEDVEAALRGSRSLKGVARSLGRIC